MSHNNDIRKLIKENSRRLQKLKEQNILTEIEDIEAELNELQPELLDLEDSGKPNPSFPLPKNLRILHHQTTIRSLLKTYLQKLL